MHQHGIWLNTSRGKKILKILYYRYLWKFLLLNLKKLKKVILYFEV